MGANVIDVMLAGHLGAHVLGAVSVGANLWGLALMAMVGVMFAVSPNVAQLDGAGRRGETGVVFRQALWLGLGLGMLMLVLVFFPGPLLLAASGLDPAIVRDATGFLRAASFGAPALCLYLACRGLSEGLSLPRPPLLVSAASLVVMLPLGYLLMYRLGLGAVGSGLTGAVICWVQLCGLATWLRLDHRYRGIGIGVVHGPRGPDARAIAALLRLGLPIAFSVLMEVGMFTAATFGDAAVASHQIALTVSAVAFMIPLGMGMAVTVRVGNAVGRGDPALVRRAGFAGVVLTLVTQAVSCAVLLTLPGPIAGLYTGDPVVLAGAVSLLGIAAIFQVSDGIQVVSNAALRGLKDARLPMLITGFAYWGVGLPLGWYLAFAGGLRVVGMWIGLVAGLSVAALLLLARFHVLSARSAAGRVG
jgi:MATE family multidrug resistance protein